MGNCVDGQEVNHLILKDSLLNVQEWSILKCRNLNVDGQETSRDKEGAPD